jgi:hypothetical protein
LLIHTNWRRSSLFYEIRERVEGSEQTFMMTLGVYIREARNV